MITKEDIEQWLTGFGYLFEWKKKDVMWIYSWTEPPKLITEIFIDKNERIFIWAYGNKESEIPWAFAQEITSKENLKTLIEKTL